MHKNILLFMGSVFMLSNLIVTTPVQAWQPPANPSQPCSTNPTYTNNDDISSESNDVLEEIANGEIDANLGIQAAAQSVIDGTNDPLTDQFAFIHYKDIGTGALKLTYAHTDTGDANYDNYLVFERIFGETGFRINGDAWTYTSHVSGNDAYYDNAVSKAVTTQYGFNGLHQAGACIDWVAGNVNYEASYDGVLYETYQTSDNAGTITAWVQGTDVAPCVGSPFYTNDDSDVPAPAADWIGELNNAVDEWEFHNGTIPNTPFDPNDPTHSAVFYRTETDPVYLEGNAIIFYETHATEQITITTYSLGGTIYNVFEMPPSAYRVIPFRDAAGDFGEPFEHYYFGPQNPTARARHSSEQYSIHAGQVPKCVQFAYNVDTDPSFTDSIPLSNDPDDGTGLVDPDPPCGTFDIACHVSKIFQGVADTFISVGQAIVSGIAALFLPDPDLIAGHFTDLFDLLQEKLGFLTYPFTLFADVLGGLQSAVACGTSCDINFGNWFGGDLVIDPLEVQESIPQVWTIIVSVVRASTVIGLTFAFYHKFKEVAKS